jgi:hypothetical protein
VTGQRRRSSFPTITFWRRSKTRVARQASQQQVLGGPFTMLGGVPSSQVYCVETGAPFGNTAIARLVLVSRFDVACAQTWCSSHCTALEERRRSADSPSPLEKIAMAQGWSRWDAMSLAREVTTYLEVREGASVSQRIFAHSTPARVMLSRSLCQRSTGVCLCWPVH